MTRSACDSIIINKMKKIKLQANWYQYDNKSEQTKNYLERISSYFIFLYFFLFCLFYIHIILIDDFPSNQLFVINIIKMNIHYLMFIYFIKIEFCSTSILLFTFFPFISILENT